jgi:hypothetical protein
LPYSLSEQKVFRDSIIEIVDEKNQKNEKLLPETPSKNAQPGQRQRA